MVSRIPFPFDHSDPNPLNWVPRDGDFYTEENGMRWQWSSVKHRWSFKPPPAISSAYQTVSSADGPPTDETLPWYNPDDGTWSIFAPQGDEPGVWVVSSGAGTDGEDGADLTETATIVPLATGAGVDAHTLVTANIDKYLRFTLDGAKTVIVPEFDSNTFAPVAGNIITLRNAATTGDLTIEAASLDVTIHAFSGGLVLAPDTSAQIIYVDTNQWDLL